VLHHCLDDKPWFRPKRIGYGSGLPIAWQGWVLMISHAMLIAGIAHLLLQRHVIVGAVLMIVAVVAPLPVYRARTKGGWHWR
jgi:hypothetical protein